MCELAVTMNLYEAKISLSHAEAHYFQIRGIPIRCVCLMSVPLHKNF